jgi:hypothetical protein
MSREVCTNKRYLIAVYVVEHWRSHACAPSISDLCTVFDSQYQNIWYHLSTLVDDGYLMPEELPMQRERAA